MYWSGESDVPTILADSIRCIRFEDILHNLHFTDNSKMNTKDRLFKLRSVLEHLENKLLLLYSLEEHISIDEFMIPYFGRHYAKQFIKGKPIRYGFKNWALYSSTGYMYAFDVYIGKASNKGTDYGLGVGGNTVLYLIKKAKIPENQGYKIYFDNYFTSYNLLDNLSNLNICATGTVRENRLKNCLLPRNDNFKKKAKGSVQSSFTSNIAVTKFKDNNVVTIATNWESCDMGTTRKYSTEKKSFIQVPQPKIVKTYNQNMGGVDMFDQFVSSYRSRMRQKKWWWPILVYFLDGVVVNSWHIWKKIKQEKVSLLHFRRNLAISILKTFGTPSRRDRHLALPKPSVRYDCTNHWVEKIKTQEDVPIAQIKQSLFVINVMLGSIHYVLKTITHNIVTIYSKNI